MNRFCAPERPEVSGLNRYLRKFGVCYPQNFNPELSGPMIQLEVSARSIGPKYRAAFHLF